MHHEDHKLFRQEHDEQLLVWMQRSESSMSHTRSPSKNEANLNFVSVNNGHLIFPFFRYSKDWNIPLGNSFSIFGWGHNHRGQLGGVEGNKVKVPRLCESFSELSPVQIIGGEQTMFAVTQDGKVQGLHRGGGGEPDCLFILLFLSCLFVVFCLFVCFRCMRLGTGRMVVLASEALEMLPRPLWCPRWPIGWW